MKKQKSIQSAPVILAVFLGILICFLFGSISYIKDQLYTAVLPGILVSLSNQNRADLNIPVLKSNPLLVRAAELKANDMAQKGYFAHTSPDGHKPWYWLDQAGYRYLAAGENLAVNFNESEDVIKEWMNSPKHRANMLNSKYTEIGIATAQGKLDGDDAVFIVEFLAKPEIQSAKDDHAF
jgi:hypothetical protein